MNIVCLNNFESSPFKLLEIFAPFAVSTVTYFVFGSLTEFKKRRVDSKLGASVLCTLKLEIQRGLKEMNEVFAALDKRDTSKLSYKSLPNKTWIGINTVNDDVLIRILETTKDKKDLGFPPSEIRTHLKNYFEYIVENWNTRVDKVIQYPANKAEEEFNDLRLYPEATDNVIKMLDNIIEALKINSSKFWPK